MLIVEIQNKLSTKYLIEQKKMLKKSPIYLDYNATTPCDPKVVNEMLPYFKENFGKRFFFSV